MAEFVNELPQPQMEEYVQLQEHCLIRLKPYTFSTLIEWFKQYILIFSLFIKLRCMRIYYIWKLSNVFQADQISDASAILGVVKIKHSY